MIDHDLLKQLGWSDELIEAVTRSSEPLRNTNPELLSIEMPESRTYSVSASALYIGRSVSKVSNDPPSG